jgi:glycosyltransferase involved in cell wall biosynthesis
LNTKLSIIIPVRNESINVRVMLRILVSALDFPHEVLVVYDSKNDTTIPIVKKLQRKNKTVRLIHNTLGKGVANAIKSGVNASNGKYILIFAADEVGPVLAVEDMIFLMDKGCELVSCTRYAYGGRRLGGSTTQAILSRMGNSLFRLLGGLPLTDATTGIKMFRRDIFDKLDLQSNVGWAVLFELAIKAKALNIRMGEVPIVSIDRLYGGSSTFRIGPWLKEYMKWFVYGLKNRPKRKIKKILVKIPTNIN